MLLAVRDKEKEMHIGERHVNEIIIVFRVARNRGMVSLIIHSNMFHYVINSQ